jgi:anti-anti-sigma factor
VLVLSGEFDCAVEMWVRAELELVAESSRLVIDLRELTFMDSTGVHLLLEARRACAASGRRLRIVPAPPHVQRALALCGVDDAFERAEATVRPAHAAGRSDERREHPDDGRRWA